MSSICESSGRCSTARRTWSRSTCSAGGVHTTAVPIDRLTAQVGPFDYHVSVHRSDRFEDFLVYPIRLDERLPEIVIPSLHGDPDVPIWTFRPSSTANEPRRHGAGSATTPRQAAPRLPPCVPAHLEISSQPPRPPLSRGSGSNGGINVGVHGTRHPDQATRLAQFVRPEFAKFTIVSDDGTARPAGFGVGECMSLQAGDPHTRGLAPCMSLQTQNRHPRAWSCPHAQKALPQTESGVPRERKTVPWTDVFRRKVAVSPPRDQSRPPGPDRGLAPRAGRALGALRPVA